MDHRKTLVLLSAFLLGFVDVMDASVTWINPSPGSNDCGSVSESASAGSAIATLMAVTNTDTMATTSIEYQILEQPAGMTISVVKLQGGEAVVTTGETTLDREEVASFLFKIAATDVLSGTVAEVTCLITLLDANDNAPTSDINNLRLELPTDHRGRFLTFTVTDADATDQNNLFDTSLTTPIPSFKLNPLTTLAPAPTLRFELVVEGVLIPGEYSMQVISVDHGTPAKSSSSDVTVIVTDKPTTPAATNATTATPANTTESAENGAAGLATMMVKIMVYTVVVSNLVIQF